MSFLSRKRNQIGRLLRKMEILKVVLLEDSHCRKMLRGNLYREYDLGFKNIAYPGGTKRIRTTKIFDTSGISFLVFHPDTPLGIPSSFSFMKVVDSSVQP